MSIISPQGHNEETMHMAGMNGMHGMNGMMGMGGESLDDIIMQNNQEMHRRQSLPQGYSAPDMDQRSSMIEFGTNEGNLSGYQFGTPTTSAIDPSMRRQSHGELDMSGYANIGPQQVMNINSQQMGFSTMPPQNALTINTNTQYSNMQGNMMQNMMGYGPMGMDPVSAEDQAAMNNMNMFSPGGYSNPYGGGSLDLAPNEFMMAGNDGLATQGNNMRRNDDRSNELVPAMPSLNISEALVTSPQNMSMNQSMASFSSPAPSNLKAPQSTRESSYSVAPTPSASVAETDIVVKTEPKYHGIYSTSGFDMLGALMKVATRKNPEIDIGKVDMSCAFVVCDITQYDCPIIYISDVFERLTGYSKHEVKGQNCRFLQSPEGKVEAGTERHFTENESVYYLRNRIAEKKEAQRSLVNYRKGGQPFINLLTMIPITGEDDKEIRYFVGFQVDLVAKPTSVEGQNAAGMYQVDYSQTNLPRYVWQPPEGVRPSLDGGQTISRDDVSTVLNSMMTSTESELTKRMWDKILLENTDDVVHVLSLKGLFMYLSPSSLKVLEYDSSELVGTPLSSVCHPSDIVPVTRELKDTSTGAAVSVVFRIRRKKSGYTWFESHGSLCVEQGKGRKCIILVGRERPVYAIGRGDIESAGGLGESEMWTKISTSGMFLFVSSNVRSLLDRASEDLIGTSIQVLMRQESRVEFGRSLEKARTGQRVTHKHEILNRKGLVLQAQTTLYPGDAAEGQKPTFLVAQTRLLKSSSRHGAPALISHGSGASMSSKSRIESMSENSTPSTHQSGLSSAPGQELTPRSTTSQSGVQNHQIGAGPITQAGGSGLMIGSQDDALASPDNIFDELKTTRCASWQFELRQMEKTNRILAEELAGLLASKKKRKRRKGAGNLQRDCANCHTRVTPEWRRGPSGQRDLCNSCGLRWAKQVSRSNSNDSGTIRQPAKGWSPSDSSTSRS